MLRLFRLAALALVATLSAAAASPIRDGFNANTLARNDDGSTGLVSLGFGVDFYGTLGSSLYVNNNGSVSFGAAMASYSPSAFPISGIAVAGITGIIAPFYADVDTRFGGSPVTYGTGTVNGHLAFGVNWIDVARYYSEALSPERNSFQLVLVQRSDRAAGAFDIEFNYGSIAWDTGTASGGRSAVVGFSEGQTDYWNIQGSSQTGALLNGGPKALVKGTNLLPGFDSDYQLGRYRFQVGQPVPAPVPLPAGGVLLVSVLAGLGLMRRKGTARRA